MSGPRRSAHLEPPDHEPRHAIGGGMDNDCKGILMLDLIEPALNTTPTPLLRAKLAAGTVAFAVFAGATIGQPASTMLTAQAGGPAQHHVAVQLVAEISDTSATVGVADSNLYNLSQDELVDRLNDMKSLGVTDLRIAVPWMYIQPTSATSYDWSKMDSVVDTASSMGFSITGAISGNPKWDGTPLAGAPNPTAYATFASAVASRYGTKIGAYEVWNEPNGVVFFAPVSAAKYTEVLKAAYTAIKAANPDAIVLAGALGATGNIGGVSVSPQKFLEQMYAAGAAGYFDALSYHPYGTSLPFSAGADVNNAALQQIQTLYSIMVANGDGDLKIWGTEFGNATTPGIGLTTAEQAQFLQDFVTAWNRLPFTGPSFVYTAQDIQTGALNAEANFGLFNSDGTPKPAALLLAKLIAELDAGGTLPDYTAPKLSQARDAYLQLASIAFGLVNTGLIIPNAIVAAVYNEMPAPARRAFTALANIVTKGVAAVVTAMGPMVQAGIQALINVTNVVAVPKATAKPALTQQDTVATADVHPAERSIAENVRDTQLTVAGAVRGVESALADALHGTQLTLRRLTAEAPKTAEPTQAATLPSTSLPEATPVPAATAQEANSDPEAFDSEDVSTSDKSSSTPKASPATPKAASTQKPAETDQASSTKPDQTSPTRPDPADSATSTGKRPQGAPKHRKESAESSVADTTSTVSSTQTRAASGDRKDGTTKPGPRHARADRADSPKQPKADS
ncbi:cellulase family glycosylhydrolase [Mycobacterium hackensackense]|uniref:cellulase family glycosylhydrolase n=1 Tax=Mycobacterium hackensackense TaxID=228909 RepID=UPI002265C455|nr:cellulase family glycosylhydrolase [Mycobacterium hackensackense]MCV7257002.1 cellulase family glycosylhydrolase [Mycobacterium hackensackense]